MEGLGVTLPPVVAQRSYAPAPPLPTRPVLQVDTPSPTADKPQSKLWYRSGTWWALLPTSTGPSLWQRTPNGWVEAPEIRESLKGVPGRVDVWANETETVAVGVGTHSLVVFKLEKKRNHWKAQVLVTLAPPIAGEAIETATIVQDRAGRWWVAADAGGKVCVWSAKAKGTSWTNPLMLAEGLDKDDICLVSLLPDGIGVIWSDQRQEAIKIRMHQDRQPSHQWNPEEVIEAGHKTADDHLNSVLTTDGTLWLATKNSLDEKGKEQLVLRVRSKQGRWANFPYAPLGAVREPSRPIVVATENLVLAGHTVYNRENAPRGDIVFGRIDTTQAAVLVGLTTVMAPDTAGWKATNRINDVTGPKQPFPLNAPWIVLASDQEGRVYEADLRFLASKQR